MQGFLFSLLTISVACSFIYPESKLPPTSQVNPEGSTVEERFLAPPGYTRNEEGGRGKFYRSLALFEHGKQVLLFNQEAKSNQSIHAAVIKIDMGTKDLQQCADACIRLHAEYLWSQKRFDEIHYELTNGWRMAYKEWRMGKRLVVKGNQTSWSGKGQLDTTYLGFRNYLDHVFIYAGTISVHRETTKVAIEHIAIGDVIVQAGSPGHAVMVIDMAEHPSGKKLIMLAQSYMPAQEIHIIKNPHDDTVWHQLPKDETFLTAEWTFDHFKIGRF